MRKLFVEYLSFSDCVKVLCKMKLEEIYRVMNIGFLLVYFCIVFRGFFESKYF